MRLRCYVAVWTETGDGCDHETNWYHFNGAPKSFDTIALYVSVEKKSARAKL